MAARRRNTPTTDCTCTPPRPHGDQHTYQVHRCGCDACRDGYQQHLARQRDARALGWTAYVDNGPAAERIRLLNARGVTTQALAADLGRSPNTLYQLARQARPRCERALAEEVLAYPIPAP